ncbi:MAG: sulfite exporter TauE/SafE family protein [Limisphaerales bacterium]
MDLLTLSFALTLSALIGLSLGLLGSGGSIITLPVLVYVARVPAQQAVGMSLVIVGGTSALGTLLNLRQGAFDWRAAAFFSVSGMVGAFIGAKFTHLVSAPVLLLLFGALMLVVGTRMLRKNETDVQPQQCRVWQCLGVGVTVGVLTGFLGVGGGFLILPALVLFAGLEMKTAIGTSLAVIAVNCSGGLLGQLRYVNFDWWLTLGFLSAAMAGMFAGTRMARWLAASTLKRGFAWCVVLLGIALVARNLMILMRPN